MANDRFSFFLFVCQLSIACFRFRLQFFFSLFNCVCEDFQHHLQCISINVQNIKRENVNNKIAHRMRMHLIYWMVAIMFHYWRCCYSFFFFLFGWVCDSRACSPSNIEFVLTKYAESLNIMNHCIWMRLFGFCSVFCFVCWAF